MLPNRSDAPFSVTGKVLKQDGDGYQAKAMGLTSVPPASLPSLSAEHLYCFLSVPGPSEAFLTS